MCIDEVAWSAFILSDSYMALFTVGMIGTTTGIVNLVTVSNIVVLLFDIYLFLFFQKGAPAEK
jgi:hypothetical protein